MPYEDDHDQVKTNFLKAFYIQNFKYVTEWWNWYWKWKFLNALLDSFH